MLNYKGKGTRREALLGGRHNPVIPGLVTLDRGPDQSLGVRPISPSHQGLRGTRTGGVALLGGVQIRCDWGYTPWNEYFSGPVSKG